MPKKAVLRIVRRETLCSRTVISRTLAPYLSQKSGGIAMFRYVLAAAMAVSLAMATSASAEQRAYGRTWGGASGSTDWNRFYHYPYVYYPQNFYGQEYFQSSDSMYNRYPPEMQIPVYNKKWHNMYPSNHRYHSGHHFILDVF